MSETVTHHNKDLAQILKRQRLSIAATLRELGARSGVSSSHLGRIERGERFPSAHILQKIAEPLGFNEGQLLTLAGFLSHGFTTTGEDDPGYSGARLDPYVASMLAQEPLEV